MKKRIKKIEREKVEYYIKCPLCDKEITGTSPSMMEYNLETHMRTKHKEESKCQ